MHKYVYYKLELPSVFTEYFELNKSIHHHDTRQREHFRTYFVQSEIGKRAIKFKGSMLWNNLPTDIKTIKSFSSCKHVLITVSELIGIMLCCI